MARKTISNKVLCSNTFKIAKNLNYHRYQRGLGSIVYKFFDTMSVDAKIFDGALKSKIMSIQQSAEEFYKWFITKFGNQKVYSSFNDSIYGADLGDMQLKNQYNKGFHFFIVSSIFLTNTHGLFDWTVKKSIATTNPF